MLVRMDGGTRRVIDIPGGGHGNVAPGGCGGVVDAAIGVVHPALTKRAVEMVLLVTGSLQTENSRS